MNIDQALVPLLNETYAATCPGFKLFGWAVDHAIDIWPKGSRHFGVRAYSHDTRGGHTREIDISLWKYQLLVSITAAAGQGNDMSKDAA